MAFHAAPPPPFLLPQNRKLRHLRGIFLRNLTFPQHRKHSIDDSAVGVGGASTADREKKRASLRKALHHARSSDDLRTDKAGAARGRSATLSGATALARQHILEEALDSSTADAFFSLHSEGLDAPLYVSEVGERATVRHLPRRPRLHRRRHALTPWDRRTLTFASLTSRPTSIPCSAARPS